MTWHKGCRPLVIILLALAASLPARAADPPAPRILRVATGQAQPFVSSRDGVLTGFSIDLWNALSQRLRVVTIFSDLGVRSDEAQLQAVQRGEADVAISAIVLTPAREEVVDFSVAYFDSGLQILVNNDQADTPWETAMEAVMSPAIGRLLLAGLVIILLLANLLWLVERRQNPQFQRGYLKGMMEGIWGVVLIIATGEHGDRDAPSMVKRVTVAFMWLFGVVLIAQFTANVTTSLTVGRMQSSIQGPADLPGRAIATQPGSIAAQYLARRGLPFLPVATAEEAAEALRRGRVQAVIYDAPSLQYFAGLPGNDRFSVVGPVFWPEKFAIAVPLDSPLRRDINRALLQMFADGSYEEIRQRWFSH